jgi:meiotically up-regulated gene 157 (Mug157) protein
MLRIPSADSGSLTFDAAKTLHTLSHDLFLESDGTVYVQTGDIPAMWLRDSSAQMAPYVRFVSEVPTLRPWFRRVIERNARNIAVDPYANAFRADYGIWERKWEPDSLSYPVALVDSYWLATDDRRIFTPGLHAALRRIMETYDCEEHHSTCSAYRHRALSDSTRGGGRGDTGLLWCGFRPSDDPTEEPFNIPQEMFAVVSLRELAMLARVGYGDVALGARALASADRLEAAIERFGRYYDFRFGWMYVYETDGRGNVRLMDDANIPDLIAAPLYGYVSRYDPTYANTRRFALSDANPYFFRGRFVSGIGSPHTTHGWVWPLAIATRALTAEDNNEVAEQLSMLATTTGTTGFVPESIDADDPSHITRAEFGWANAHYAELLYRLASTFRTPRSPAHERGFSAFAGTPVSVTGLTVIENDAAIVAALSRLFPIDPA